MTIKPLVCTECGGHIDRDTMTCKFCGIQFELDNYFQPIIVKRFDTKINVLESYMSIPQSMFDLEHERGKLQNLTEYAVKELARQFADKLIPFMEVRREYTPRFDNQEIRARVRVAQPFDSNNDMPLPPTTGSDAYK